MAEGHGLLSSPKDGKFGLEIIDMNAIKSLKVQACFFMMGLVFNGMKSSIC